MRLVLAALFLPALLSLSAAFFGSWLALGTTLYRAGFVAGPLILGGLAYLLLQRRMIGFSGLVLVAGSVLVGLYGFVMEWQRLSLWGFQGTAAAVANLDVPLICVSAMALLLPFASLFSQVSITLPTLSTTARKGSVFGSARWMTLAEAKRRFQGGQLVIGAAYEAGKLVKDAGSQAPLLTYQGDGHLLTVGGSGSGKTRTIVKPNCRYWRGPMVVLDPKGDLGLEMGPIRRRLGHRVLILNPHDPATDAINVLDWLDPSTDNIVLEADTVVSWMIDNQASEGSNGVFIGQARSLIHAVLIDMLCDPTLAAQDKTLLGLYGRLQGAALGTTIMVMESRHPSYGWGVPHTIGTEMNELRNVEETWRGVAIYLANAIGFLKAGGAARMLSGVGRTTVPTSAILDGDVDVFIAVPLRTLMSTPAIARLALGALLNTVYRQEERPGLKQEVLFLLDEMPRLGSMPLLETARDAGRSAGIRLWCIVQDFGQLKKAYGDTGLTSWLANSAVQTFIGINDPETAKWLADAIGQTDIEVSSRGNSSSKGPAGLLTTQRGYNSSTNTTGTYLITPSEIMRMHTDAQGNPDEHIVLVRQMDPLRCGVVRADEHQGLLS